MEYHHIDCGQSPATVRVSHFRGSSGVDEYHMMICPTQEGNIELQLSWLAQAYQQALTAVAIPSPTAVFRRFFCSDPASQAHALAAAPFSSTTNQAEPCAISLIGQPPPPPAKVALWAYHLHDPQSELVKSQEDSSLAVKRGALTHHWTTGLTKPSGATSAEQTRELFLQYCTYLQEHNLTLADHVVRTWLFVQNIDANYQGLVDARREFFIRQGLTPNTHFIASTGIEGAAIHNSATVSMDAYAISGLCPAQVKYLTAPDQLGPTQLYGVTFERGASVAYRDRKHVLISGTASINPEGKILHQGDVTRQLERTLENIEALLNDAGATFANMCMFIVYLRQQSDYAIVTKQMRERFGAAPLAVTAAPVCRPGWLVEVEGMAIVPTANPQLPAF